MLLITCSASLEYAAKALVISVRMRSSSALLPCGKQSSFRFQAHPPLDRISAQFGINPFALAPNFRKLRGCAVAHAKSRARIPSGSTIESARGRG